MKKPAGPDRVSTRTRAFVDGIEDDVARLIIGERTFHLPISTLPSGAREGDWVTIAIATATPPATDTEALRKKLSRDDPGGDIKL